MSSFDTLAARFFPFISPDFLRFGIVGTIGFCWDTSTVYLLRHSVGLYVAGTAGFIVAATSNWALNRFWTFQHRTHDAMHRQWLRFLITNLIGFAVNRGLFFTLVSINPLCRNQPVIPIILGSIAGLGFNYVLSRKFVFAE